MVFTYNIILFCLFLFNSGIRFFELKFSLIFFLLFIFDLLVFAFYSLLLIKVPVVALICDYVL